MTGTDYSKKIMHVLFALFVVGSSSALLACDKHESHGDKSHAHTHCHDDAQVKAACQAPAPEVKTVVAKTVEPKAVTVVAQNVEPVVLGEPELSTAGNMQQEIVQNVIFDPADEAEGEEEIDFDEFLKLAQRIKDGDVEEKTA